MKKDKVKFYRSYRFIIAVIGSFGYALQYMQKIDMGIGIVCMVNTTAVNGLINANTSIKSEQQIGNFSSLLKDESCELKHLTVDNGPNSGTFTWSKDIQGWILSSYFYGYISTQILAGVLASKFGSKIMIFIGMFGASLFTLLVPLAARLGYVALIACRIITGMTQSFFMPGMSTLWVYWAPPDERSRLIGMSHSGGMIGNIVALLSGGYLCFYGFDGGWPSIFFIFGGLGMLWVCVMLIMFSNTPNTQRFISPVERNHINTQTQHSSHQKNIKIPWAKIFKSKACWAIFISHLSNNWGIFLYMTQLPSFMKEVLKFDIKSNGFWSAIPFLACFIFISLSSLCADKLIRTGKFRRITIRKLFNGLGLSVPILTLIGLSFITCRQPYLGVVLLTIGIAFIGCSLGAGFYQAQYEWSYVFILCAGIYLVGLIVYSVFAQADLETWAISNDEKVVEDLDNIELEKKKKPTTMNEKEDGIVLESPTKF